MADIIPIIIKSNRSNLDLDCVGGGEGGEHWVCDPINAGCCMNPLWPISGNSY
jgi:hypothetical protein